MSHIFVILFTIACQCTWTVRMWPVGWTLLWKWPHIEILFLFSLHAAIMMMEKQEPSFNATYAETCVLTAIDFCIYIAVLTYTRDRWEIFHSFIGFSTLHWVLWVCPIHWFDKEFADILLISPTSDCFLVDIMNKSKSFYVFT